MNRGLLFFAIMIFIAERIDINRHNKKVEELFPSCSDSADIRNKNLEMEFSTYGNSFGIFVLILMLVDNIIKEGF